MVDRDGIERLSPADPEVLADIRTVRPCLHPELVAALRDPSTSDPSSRNRIVGRLTAGRPSDARRPSALDPAGGLASLGVPSVGLVAPAQPVSRSISTSRSTVRPGRASNGPVGLVALDQGIDRPGCTWPPGSCPPAGSASSSGSITRARTVGPDPPELATSRRRSGRRAGWLGRMGPDVVEPAELGRRLRLAVDHRVEPIPPTTAKQHGHDVRAAHPPVTVANRPTLAAATSVRHRSGSTVGSGSPRSLSPTRARRSSPSARPATRASTSSTVIDPGVADLVLASRLARRWNTSLTGVGTPWLSAEQHDLTVQEVGLDRSGAAGQALPRRRSRPRPDPARSASGEAVAPFGHLVA